MKTSKTAKIVEMVILLLLKLDRWNNQKNPSDTIPSKM